MSVSELTRSNTLTNLEVKTQIDKHLHKLNSKLFKHSVKKPKRTLVDLITTGHQPSENSNDFKVGSNVIEEIEEGVDEVDSSWFGEKEDKKDIITVRVGRKIKRLILGGPNNEALQRSNTRFSARPKNKFNGQFNDNASTTSSSTSVESLGSQLMTDPSTSSKETPSPNLQLPNLFFTPITSTSSEISTNIPPTRTLTIKNTTVRIKSRRNRLLVPVSKLKNIISNNSSFERSRDSLDSNGIDDVEKFAYEVLYEHQRGAFVFARARFSGDALNQLDPAPWTDEKQRDSPFTPNSFPLPSLFHQWSTNWLVDMGGDVDEAGWSYSYLFHSNYWRGKPNMMFSFVRRRRWIRGRVYLPPTNPPLSSTRNRNLKTNIDWSPSPPNLTPSDGSQIGNSINSGPLPVSPTGLRAACALLPLDSRRKSAIFSWSAIELHARNPFLNYKWVIKSGAEEIVRIKEERARLRLERHEKGISPGGSGIERSEDLLMEVFRDAVMEINYRRVSRVLKEVCRVDREKVELWEWWMGKGGDAGKVPECACRTIKKGKGKYIVEGNSSIEEKPDIEDVWSLVEGRLDQILAQFEFQSNRLSFLNLILSLHPTSHAQHKFKGIDSERPLPEELDSAGVGSMYDRKLSFWRDVEGLRKTYRQ